MQLEEQVPLAPLTTFQIGGSARFVARVSNVILLMEAVRYAQEKKIPYFVLGGGSNVLVADEGFPGLVLKIEIKGMSFFDRGNFVEAVVGAGESWDGFVQTAVAQGLFGVENLSGIPGSVGAAPIQNIGAYGAEAADVITEVAAVDTLSGERMLLSREKCAFAYRNSFFKTDAGRHLVVTHVHFRLEKMSSVKVAYHDLQRYFGEIVAADSPSLEDVREAVLQIRSRKFPSMRTAGTAGSFFKNPIVSEQELEKLLLQFPELPHFPMGGNRTKIALGWLLEQLGWKGFRVGDAGVFEHHALVLTNFGGASARDVKNLSALITQNVFERVGINIQPEIIFVEARL